MRRRNFVLLGLCILLAACHDEGSNSDEARYGALVRDVDAYYESLNDSVTSLAVSFLLGPVMEHYHYAGESVDAFNELFVWLDSLHRDNLWNDEALLEEKFDALSGMYGMLDVASADKVPDVHMLTPQLLISNIDNALAAWQTASWHDSVDFQTFCNFILPYKAGTECPEDFRPVYRDYYAAVLDTAKGLFDAARIIACDLLERGFYSSGTMWKYPFDLPMNKIEQGKRGSCRHLVNYAACILRANGIPAAIDYVPQWGNRSTGHIWNVLMLPGDSIYPFDVPTKSFSALQFAYKPSKIFRRMYHSDVHLPTDTAFLHQVPDELKHGDRDVTGDYVTTYNPQLPVGRNLAAASAFSYAVLCVFDNEQWVPVDWGTLCDGVLSFSGTASDVLYLGCVYRAGRLLPVTEPFILHPDGRIQWVRTDMQRTQHMTLDRKYPIFKRVAGYMTHIKWSRVEVSDREDFEGGESLFTVDFVPEKYVDTALVCARPYRYIRFRTNRNSVGDVAEVEFYGKHRLQDEEIRLTGRLIGSPTPDASGHAYTSAVDGSAETYFSKSKGVEGWVGYELQEPCYVTRVRFCPRSDTNFVMPGDVYELCWWNGASWTSAGRQRAASQEVCFHDVPSDGLYLLHNRTRGREERIFVWENGRQVFY